MPTPTVTPSETTAGRRGRLAGVDWHRYVIYIGFVVVFLFFAVLLRDQGFLSANNLLNILRQTATITVIAVAMVGRNVTFHEYSAAVGLFDDPVYAWAGGGYVSSSSFQFYEHDDSRGFASGGHIACAGVGIPLPINWGLPDRPLWGAQAKQMDRDYFNHSMRLGCVCQSR